MSSRHTSPDREYDNATRRRVPTGTADAVMYDSDCTCCMCHDKQKRVVVHHLDGNPANNHTDNFAILCHEDHDKAHASSGTSRHLTAGVIRKYRDAWTEEVRGRRVSKDTAAHRTPTRPEQLIEAVASIEARKLGWELPKTAWKDSAGLLERLGFYANCFRSDAVSDEVMEALYGLAVRTRYGMPPDVANWIDNLILPTTGIWSLVASSRRLTPPHQKELLRRALDIGANIAYDAVKYLGDIKVMAAGTRVMFYALRYAELNRLAALKREALKEFKFLEATAKECHFDDARRWLTFERQDALCVGGSRLPRFPRDVDEKISGAGPKLLAVAQRAKRRSDLAHNRRRDEPEPMKGSRRHANR